MLVCALFVHIAHETAGAARTRSSLRPLSFGANEFAKLGRMMSREYGVAFGDRSPHERSDMRVCRGPAYRFAHAGYVLKRSASLQGALANRTIQYSEGSVMETTGRDVLDPPVEPGMTVFFGATLGLFRRNQPWRPVVEKIRHRGHRLRSIDQA